MFRYVTLESIFFVCLTEASIEKLTTFFKRTLVVISCVFFSGFTTMARRSFLITHELVQPDGFSAE